MPKFDQHFVFFEGASASTVGNEFSVPGNVSPLAVVAVTLSGVPSSKTVLFQGKGDGGGYTAVAAKNLKTATSASQTTATADEVWTIPAAGFTKIRCYLSAISGSATAKGEMIY